MTPAESRLESALAQFCELGIPFGRYRALISLGHLRRAQRKWAESRAHYREALAVQAEIQFIQFAAQILEGTGHLAVAEDNPEVAVKLFGTAQARRDSIEMARWAHQQTEFQRSLALTRNQLPAAEWQAFWEEGYNMAPQEALEFALTR